MYWQQKRKVFAIYCVKDSHHDPEEGLAPLVSVEVVS